MNVSAVIPAALIVVGLLAVIAVIALARPHRRIDHPPSASVAAGWGSDVAEEGTGVVPATVFAGPVPGWREPTSSEPFQGEAEGDLSASADESESRRHGYSQLVSEAMSAPFRQRLLPVLEGLGRSLGRVTPKGNVDELRRLLVITQENPWPVLSVVALEFVLLGAGAVVGFVMAHTAEMSAGVTVAVVGLGATVGFMSPRVRLRSALKRKRGEIERALPDFLDLISVTMEAGLTFPAALMRAVETDDGSPLNRAMQRALRQYQLGIPLIQALRSVGDQLEVRPLQAVIRIIAQSERMGTSIAVLLRVHSEQLRHRRRTRARELGQQASVKMLFPMMGCIFPIILVVLLGPAIVGLITGRH